jgi:hypothetical protein
VNYSALKHRSFLSHTSEQSPQVIQALPRVPQVSRMSMILSMGMILEMRIASVFPRLNVPDPFRYLIPCSPTPRCSNITSLGFRIHPAISYRTVRLWCQYLILDRLKSINIYLELRRGERFEVQKLYKLLCEVLLHPNPKWIGFSRPPRSNAINKAVKDQKS